ncbi:bacillithiol biosynthesis cysteine-adding enzyme BshC [Bacillus sp. ISL-40]|uniref:bacillithiol biosynthesis cysteine-adding enzyme BshC n=1 Tax=unclassified Bacillus (in: firmicutes) TaxID=185979 RepID=UPI001BE54BC0|nr:MULTISPECIES: bacillithiol biosynthesis cysteine-adding enzyme BshC [unclassified Bacillus (in: firmicutes)]MBT2697725.1 bacillithiol biosynthesis cysteine-adding enzyme BshC [Bacillus sp. ISL-40]MBT2742365.1 bacillithiol biosynthesis cysteine-adding enzyme BshC [Bacillus sp. ISL-77]
MEILNLSLPATNRFASNYLEQSTEIEPFFHYRYNELTDDAKRVSELSNRSFPRVEVAEHIESFMKQFPSSEAVIKSIDKLKTNNSLVVIGGQQAGILTGPLYSIHKVISIIKLAEQKEEQLGVPVVPVFWIAGEDHDFQEVNHVFVPVNRKVDKWTYPERVVNKKMVSDIQLNKESCLSWVNNLIENFGETEHTNTLLEFAKEQISISTTFVDFFANIIMELFKDYGLLIVDSGNREFRLLQKEFLKSQILHHEAITNKLLEQQREIGKKGFPITIDASEENANLFYYDQKMSERILLEYNRGNDRFVGKNGTLAFTREQLVVLAEENPANLSNNVVTRPLMQEWLFPTVAFIAGPGEISYWAELKLVFEHFDMKMPPIVPRLNITILDRSVETDVAELHLNLAEVLSIGTDKGRHQFLEAIKDKEVESLFSITKDQLVKQYRQIEAKTAQLDRGLLPLFKKNEGYLLKEIDFLEKKLDEAVRLKHDNMIKKYARVDLALRPDGFPQERVWNVFYYLNQYGLNFIKDLMTGRFEFDGRHKVMKI